MGKVFTWEEIARGELPTRAHFEDAISMMRERIEMHPALLGAIIYGSAAHHAYTTTSDIDCFVVYEAEQRAAAFAALQEIAAAARRMYVPIEFVPLDNRSAAAGAHNISPSFAAHLNACVARHGFITSNPLQWCAPSELSDVQDYLAYARYKRNKLAKRFALLPTLPPDQHARLLAQTLATPVYLARKTLGACKVCLTDDSKAAVQAYYTQRMPRHLHKSILITNELGQQYREEIERQRRMPDAHLYTAALRNIEAHIPLVLDSITDHIIWFTENYQP